MICIFYIPRNSFLSIFSLEISRIINEILLFLIQEIISGQNKKIILIIKTFNYFSFINLNFFFIIIITFFHFYLQYIFP